CRTRRAGLTMATNATVRNSADRRLHRRHVDARSGRPRSAAFGVSRLRVPVARDARPEETDRADGVDRYCRRRGLVEARRPGCARTSRQAEVDRRRAREHHGRTGLHRATTVAPLACWPASLLAY